MMQGWSVDDDAETITFLEAPPAGTGNVVVVQNPVGGIGGTDVWAMGAWSQHYGYPREVEYFADRLWFGGTRADPQRIDASCTGDYNNFGRSSPIVDSDAFSFMSNARQMNAISDMVPLDSMLVLTEGNEFMVTGGADKVVSPSTIGLKIQSNYGIEPTVAAKVIGESAVMLQAEGPKVRDLAYTFDKDGFRGNEISVWGSHLFEGYTFTRGIDHWKAPWSVLWFSRSDGVRVGMTYMPEQEVIGTHWHDTAGEWLDACSLPGRPDTDCYYLVRRVVDGVVEQFIEQQAPTRFDTEDDLFYVDSGLTYDGRNETGTTLTVTSNTGGWGESDELVITASTAIFAGPSDIGDAFLLYYDTIEAQQIDGDLVDVAVTKRVQVIIDTDDTSTTVQAHVVGTVPAELRGVATTRWTFQRDTIADLWHLEGATVNVLQDGGVSGPYTVENGRITLNEPGGVVHVGHGYRAEVETLELNAQGEPTRDMSKLVFAVAITVQGTRGVLVQDIGRRAEPMPMQDRSDEPFGAPPRLRSGVFQANVPSTWGVDAGRIRLISDDPLPMEVLSITVKAAGSVRT